MGWLLIPELTSRESHQWLPLAVIGARTKYVPSLLYLTRLNLHSIGIQPSHALVITEISKGPPLTEGGFVEPVAFAWPGQERQIWGRMPVLLC